MAADSRLIQEQKENHEGLIQCNVSYADVSQFSCQTCMQESGFCLIKPFQQKEWVLKYFCHCVWMGYESSVCKGTQSRTLVSQAQERRLMPSLRRHIQSCVCLLFILE